MGVLTAFLGQLPLAAEACTTSKDIIAGIVIRYQCTSPLQTRLTLKTCRNCQMAQLVAEEMKFESGWNSTSTTVLITLHLHGSK